jgi:hypothetical protein
MNPTQLVEVSPEDTKDFNVMTARKELLEIALLKYRE